MTTFGEKMRALMDERGISLRQLAVATYYDVGYLSKVANGHKPPSLRLAQRRETKLGVDGDLVDLVPQRADGRRRLRDEGTHAAELNSESGEAGVVIPCRTQDGRIIFVTLPRRTFISAWGLGAMAAVTAGQPAPAQANTLPPRVATIPDVNPVEHFRELRRVLVDNDNLLGPLHAIPTVESQIGAIQQLRHAVRGVEDRELLYLQTQYAEFCGWLYQDAGDFRSAQYWLDRSLEWSYAAGDRDITTFIVARKSQLAGDMGDAMTAIDLSAAASVQARPRTRLGAIAATFGGYGYALAGDEAKSQQELDRARAILTNLDPNSVSGWGAWMDDAYVEACRARSLYALGRYQRAAEDFQAAIARLPAQYHRDKGVYLARESLARVGAQEPEQAAQVGLQALRVAQSTGSARIMTELAKLDSRLTPWRKVAAVTEFRKMFDSLVPRQA